MRRMPKPAWLLTIAMFVATLSSAQSSKQTFAATQSMEPVTANGLLASDVKPAPPTPIALKKAELGSERNWRPEWDLLIEKSIPPELLTPAAGRAVRHFCPRFSSMSIADKRAFWAYLFQALAGAEAGLEPTTNVRHTEPEVAVVDRVTHRMVRSEGLLQLTYEDSLRYGCDFDWDQDKTLAEHDPSKTILQPENNLLCGIKIMSNQIVNLHEPLLSPKSYWSTLRPGTISYKVFAKQMTNVPAECTGRPARDTDDFRSREAEAVFPEWSGGSQ